MRMPDDSARPACTSPRTRASASVERTVEWVDTDASGHQHNSAIMRWVEAAEARLVRDLELTEYFPAAPRVRQEVNFRSKVWFGQTVVATVTVTALGRSSLTYEFIVEALPDGARPGGLAAEGSVTVVHVPPGSERSGPWPDELRARLAPAVQPVPPEATPAVAVSLDAGKAP